MNEMNGLDLELRLRDHYRTMDVGSSSLLTSRVVDGLDRLPTARRWSVLRLPRRIATAAAIAVVGLAVTAVVAGPLWFGSAVPAVPLTSPTETAATPTPLGTATGNPSQTQAPVASVGTPDPSALLASARASALGRMGSGGAWAVQGTEFVRIPDAHSSVGDSPWPASDLEPPAVFVLDKDRAWTVTLAPGSVNGGQGPPHDHLNVIVNRKADIGVVWKQAGVPGDYTDSQLAITFADPLVGYLIASPHRGGRSTVLATTDGGATWNVVASVSLQHGSLGAEVTASDPQTLWAAAQPESLTNHPVLAVSRDSGKTWSEVTLPGLDNLWGGNGMVQTLGPPVFDDPSNGFLAVVVAGNPEIFGTTDGGHTWTMTNMAGAEMTAADFIDPTHWAVVESFGVVTTWDAGKTWRQTLGRGLPDGTFVKLAFVDQVTGYGLFQPAGETKYYLYRTTSSGDEWGLVYGIS
ncbi:MAG TPA: hypothetical protein VF375_11045 [Candidatus Limnocylindrales bacterium]